MPLYLGLDSSTQSLTAIVIEVSASRREVVWQDTLVFDEALPRYGTRHGVLPRVHPAVATSSPVMWAEALEMMLTRVSQRVPGIRRLAAIAGSAQQHGSVYLNRDAAARLGSLTPSRTLAAQVPAMLARATSPIWMDTSTAAECREIAAAVGGQESLALHTGSRAFERFTGPQIRRLFKQERTTYLSTGRIHLVSSFLASLLAGRHAPLDPGDASGMNLYELTSGNWWLPALQATAPDLASRLPAVEPSWTIVGRLGGFWQARCGMPPARVVAWSGDNPCSAIGTGLVTEGRLAISLGTSDTVFGLTRTARPDPGGSGHVFASATGDFLDITVFRNGSLAREQVRQDASLSWEDFSQVLAETPPGFDGRLLLPWYEPEITPSAPVAGVHRHRLAPGDALGHVRAVVEAQMMSMALHSRWMQVKVDTIFATGGAARNRAILQVMADVFGAEVHQLEVGNSAALGAALRACHADMLADGQSVPWEEIVDVFVEPASDGIVRPIADHHRAYQDLLPKYEAFERSKA
jgi:xylulokinase